MMTKIKGRKKKCIYSCNMQCFLSTNVSIVLLFTSIKETTQLKMPKQCANKRIRWKCDTSQFTMLHTIQTFPLSWFRVSRTRLCRAGSQYFFCRAQCVFLIKIEFHHKSSFKLIRCFLWASIKHRYWKQKLRFDDKHRPNKSEIHYNDEIEIHFFSEAMAVDSISHLHCHQDRFDWRHFSLSSLRFDDAFARAWHWSNE